jgi:hypothetical protein
MDRKQERRQGETGLRTEKDLRDEVRRIRERVRDLSGFWIGEASAAIYALEWALGKSEVPPSEDIGKPRGGREKIAASLLKLAEKSPQDRGQGTGVKKPDRPAPGGKGGKPKR